MLVAGPAFFEALLEQQIMRIFPVNDGGLFRVFEGLYEVFIGQLVFFEAKVGKGEFEGQAFGFGL
jgi:hypothetical protein